jgi:hypothetical protein
MDQIVKKAIEFQLHDENFNKESGFILSCTWQPVISLLKQSPQPRIDSPGQGQQPFDSFHLPKGSHSILQPAKQRHTQHRVGQLNISFGATKPPAHAEDGDGVSSQNGGKPSLSDTAVCPRKFHCTLIVLKESILEVGCPGVQPFIL